MKSIYYILQYKLKTHFSICTTLLFCSISLKAAFFCFSCAQYLNNNNNNY